VDAILNSQRFPGPKVERFDLHNASVDTIAASAHLCGMTDLRLGRVCALPLHHRGSCRFVSHEELCALVAQQAPGL
jgi:hypothetical protein